MPLDDPASHQKMRCVAGMRGSSEWYEHGRTQFVENPHWRQYLLVNEKGEIPLDKEQAVELSIRHSPEYRSALENLYLAAMAVSRERFRYDVQFYGGDSLLYTAQGRFRGTGANTMANDANLRAEKLLASGGEWIVELANSVTWTLNGQGNWNVDSSLLNITLVQPLLRGAGRKYVLESLTQTERNFLSEVRQMVLYQQGHYTRVVTGSGQQDGPSAGAARTSRANTPSFSGGFYKLLADQIQIQNQRQNIVGLKENLSRFEEMFEAGQIRDLYQVEQTRQSLLVAQSRLWEQVNAYEASVETYIRSLGLPPDLEVSISDPLLEQFQLVSPTLTILQEDVGELLTIVRKKDQPIPDHFREKIKDIVRRTQGEIAVLEQDLELLQKSVPKRLQGLKNLEAFLADRIEHGEQIDPVVYDTEIFEGRIAKLRTEDIPKNFIRLRAAFTLLDWFVNSEEQALRTAILARAIDPERTFDPSIEDALRSLSSTTGHSVLTRQQEPEESVATEEPSDPLRRERQRIIAELRQTDEYRDWIRRVLSAFQNELILLSLLQTRARLDAMTLIPVSVTADEAFQTASENRLDWMNRKSQLVDRWRRIDIAANELQGYLQLRLRGDTGRIDRQGVHFGADHSRLRVDMEWDSPLTRHSEMLNYRHRQIEYQAARRDYYTYVDSVQAELRNNVRNVLMRQIEFEISRNAVLVDTVRVDIMQLRMEQPPRGGGIDTNTSTQLIDALNGLTRSQNTFLDTWVAYQTQRMLLDLNMGTMKLDNRGLWIDPGAMGSAIAPTLAPAVLPSDRIETPRLNRRYVEEE